MAELIFTDASAWIALIYPRDNYHQQPVHSTAL